MTIPRYQNSREHCQRAKKLRRNASLTEALLWHELLSLKNAGLHFRRQHPVYPYIADFACVKAQLLIELDRASHDNRLNYDAKRDEMLRSRGWTIVRFSNEDVLSNREGVVSVILEKIREFSEGGSSPLAGRIQKLRLTQ